MGDGLRARRRRERRLRSQVRELQRIAEFQQEMIDRAKRTDTFTVDHPTIVAEIREAAVPGYNALRARMARAEDFVKDLGAYLSTWAGRWAVIRFGLDALRQERSMVDALTAAGLDRYINETYVRLRVLSGPNAGKTRAA